MQIVLTTGHQVTSLSIGDASKINILHIRTLIRNEISFRPPGYYFTKTYQRGHWDGRISLLSSRNEFPTGLLSRVLKIFDDRQIPYTVSDLREYPLHGKDIVDLAGMEYRGYQREGILAGLKKKRGVLKLPAGTGKTEILIGLCATLNLPTLWLTEEKSLMYQTRDRFLERLPGISVGIIGEGAWEAENITVAMLQTLHKRQEEARAKALLAMPIVVFDECHHLPSSTFYRIFQACTSPFRFGCSATPLDRRDEANLRLVGATGGIIFEYTPKDAVAEGFAVPPDITFVDYDTPMVSEVNYGRAYKEGIVENAIRNTLVCRYAVQLMEQGRRVLILVTQVKHGQRLRDMLTERIGTNAYHEFLWGQWSGPQRQRAVSGFRDGVLRILIATSIFDQGIDIPELSAMVIAGAGKNLIKCIQRVGRGMRPGKEDLRVIDFLDRGHKFLISHSRKRRKNYESLGVGMISTEKAV